MRPTAAEGDHRRGRSRWCQGATTSRHRWGRRGAHRCSRAVPPRPRRVERAVTSPSWSSYEAAVGGAVRPIGNASSGPTAGGPGALAGTAMMARSRATLLSASRAKRSTSTGFCLTTDRYWRAVTGGVAVRGRPSAGRRSSAGVSTAPGHSTLTRTPCRAASGRKPSTRPTTACFVAAYPVTKGGAADPAPDAVATMCPEPRPTMPGETASIALTTPLRFTSMT